MKFNISQEQIAELYIAAIGRAPEKDGLDYWVTSLTGGDGAGNPARSLAEIRDLFLDPATSQEVQERFPETLTNYELVKSIYKNVLSRDGDQGGIDYWTARLEGVNEKGEAQIMSRGDILESILESAKQSQNDNATLENKLAFGEFAYEHKIQADELSTEGITDNLANLEALKQSIINNTNDTAPAGDAQGNYIYVDGLFTNTGSTDIFVTDIGIDMQGTFNVAGYGTSHLSMKGTTANGYTIKVDGDTMHIPGQPFPDVAVPPNEVQDFNNFLPDHVNASDFANTEGLSGDLYMQVDIITTVGVFSDTTVMHF